MNLNLKIIKIIEKPSVIELMTISDRLFIKYPYVNQRVCPRIFRKINGVDISSVCLSFQVWMSCKSGAIDTHIPAKNPIVSILNILVIKLSYS